MRLEGATGDHPVQLKFSPDPGRVFGSRLLRTFSCFFLWNITCGKPRQLGSQYEHHETHEFFKAEASAFKDSVSHKHLEMSVSTTYLSSLQVDSIRSR